MRTINTKCLIITLIGLMISGGLKAQVALSSYFDAGENNVSEGLYIRSGVLGAYKFGKNKVEGGIQLDIKNAGSKTFTGSNLVYARELSIKKFEFDIQGLFMYNGYSNLIYELNWGVLAEIERKHFIYKLGTGFRSYHITQKAITNYDIESNKVINENWNLMYLLGYNLKPIDNKWNIGITLTNIDNFLISQDTNPMVNLLGKYKFTAPFTLYAELWYKSAGSLNISSNYFGIFYRTGLIWELDLKK